MYSLQCGIYKKIIIWILESVIVRKAEIVLSLVRTRLSVCVYWGPRTVVRIIIFLPVSRKPRLRTRTAIRIELFVPVRSRTSSHFVLI